MSAGAFGSDGSAPQKKWGAKNPSEHKDRRGANESHQRRNAAVSWPPRSGVPCVTHRADSIPFTHSLISIPHFPFSLFHFHFTSGAHHMALNEEGGTPDSPVLNYSGAPSYTAVATPARRKRGPSLYRRTGQAGTVFQHCKTWDPTAPCYGKF